MFVVVSLLSDIESTELCCVSTSCLNYKAAQIYFNEMMKTRCVAATVACGVASLPSTHLII